MKDKIKNKMQRKAYQPECCLNATSVGVMGRLRANLLMKNPKQADQEYMKQEI